VKEVEIKDAADERRPQISKQRSKRVGLMLWKLRETCLDFEYCAS